ncbi:MAG: hypothetical protein QM757_18535 [Paludibaculum sp.]
MGKEIATLEAERDTLQPWEQQAIDKVQPLLKEAAANAEEAIEYFNNNHNFLWSPRYRGYAEKVKKDSYEIAKTLKNLSRSMRRSRRRKSSSAPPSLRESINGLQADGPERGDFIIIYAHGKLVLNG